MGLTRAARTTDAALHAKRRAMLKRRRQSGRHHTLASPALRQDGDQRAPRTRRLSISWKARTSFPSLARHGHSHTPLCTDQYRAPLTMQSEELVTVYGDGFDVKRSDYRCRFVDDATGHSETSGAVRPASVRIAHMHSANLVPWLAGIPQHFGFSSRQRTRLSSSAAVGSSPLS